MNIRDIVEKTLEGFIAEEKTFSSHDVTTEIREQVRKGAYVVHGIDDFILLDGKKTPKITHDLVRDFVVELMQVHKGYEGVIRKNKDGQSFRLYQPVGTSSEDSSADAASVSTASDSTEEKKEIQLESEDVDI